MSTGLVILMFATAISFFVGILFLLIRLVLYPTFLKKQTGEDIAKADLGLPTSIGSGHCNTDEHGETSNTLCCRTIKKTILLSLNDYFLGGLWEAFFVFCTVLGIVLWCMKPGGIAYGGWITMTVIGSVGTSIITIVLVILLVKDFFKKINPEQIKVEAQYFTAILNDLIKIDATEKLSKDSLIDAIEVLYKAYGVFISKTGYIDDKKDAILCTQKAFCEAKTRYRNNVENIEKTFSVNISDYSILRQIFLNFSSLEDDDLKICDKSKGVLYYCGRIPYFVKKKSAKTKILKIAYFDSNGVERANISQNITSYWEVRYDVNTRRMFVNQFTNEALSLIDMLVSCLAAQQLKKRGLAYKLENYRDSPFYKIDCRDNTFFVRKGDWRTDMVKYSWLVKSVNNSHPWLNKDKKLFYLLSPDYMLFDVTNHGYNSTLVRNTL